jgi:hypothetical protein
MRTSSMGMRNTLRTRIKIVDQRVGKTRIATQRALMSAVSGHKGCVESEGRVRP